MATTVGIIGAGAMGSAVGRLLAGGGARVLALKDGRSAASLARAEAAGMALASAAEIANAALVLSIVPPSAAVDVARGIAGALRSARTPGAYLDCNAISPATMGRIAAALEETGWAVLDGSIIGGPPVPEEGGPSLYVSGDPDGRSAPLGELGLRLKRMDAPLGAASALKMAYAGINKGVIALGTGVLLAAARSGCADSLRAEMAESQPALLAKLGQAIPDMLPKAYRWVGEMREIAAFLGPGDPAARFFEAAADLFAGMAQDRKEGGARAALLLQSFRG